MGEEQNGRLSGLIASILLTMIFAMLICVGVSVIQGKQDKKQQSENDCLRAVLTTLVNGSREKAAWMIETLVAADVRYRAGYCDMMALMNVVDEQGQRPSEESGL